MLSYLLLASLPLTATALAVVDSAPSTNPKILHFPIKSRQKALATRYKRQEELKTIQHDNGSFYTIDVKVGTPGQVVSLVLDTGSEETWVNPNCAGADLAELCETLGHFNGSSTFVDLHVKSKITYSKGFVDYDYGYDFFTIGSAKISQQIFGVGTNSSDSEAGIIGLGPPIDDWNTPYPLILDSLAEQGLIKSKAFSLDLRSHESDRGSLIFGGIDTKKFSGPLQKLPIIPQSEAPEQATRYWVNLDSVSVGLEDGSEEDVSPKDSRLTVMLDSGATASQLPPKWVEKIGRANPSLMSSKKASDLFYTTNCDSVKGTVNFRFGNTLIRVPYSDLLKRTDFGCVLSVYAGESESDYFLGDSFLRAAYVVFDWDNRNVHIAKASDCGSNLVEIGTGSDSVPALTGDCKSKHSDSDDDRPSSPESSPAMRAHHNVTAVTKPPRPSHTETYTTTRTRSITDCAGKDDCSTGAVTTEVAVITTLVYPQITATYTLSVVEDCKGNKDGCKDGISWTKRAVTVTPVTPPPATSTTQESKPTGESDVPKPSDDSNDSAGTVARPLMTAWVVVVAAGALAAAFM